MSGQWRSNQPRTRHRDRGVEEKLRQRILRRDGHQCQECGAQVGKSAPVDHLVPVFEGGTDDPDNLRTLCGPCHDRKTQTEAQRARARFARKRPPAKHPTEGNVDWGAWAAAMGRTPK